MSDPLCTFVGMKRNAPGLFKRAIEAESDDWDLEVCGATIKFATWGAVGSPGLLFEHGGRAHPNWWRFRVTLI